MGLLPSWMLRFITATASNRAVCVHHRVLASHFELSCRKSLRSCRFTMIQWLLAHTHTTHTVIQPACTSKTKHSFVRYSVEELSFRTQSFHPRLHGVLQTCRISVLTLGFQIQAEVCLFLRLQLLIIFHLNVQSCYKSNLKSKRRPGNTFAITQIHNNTIGTTQSYLSVTLELQSYEAPHLTKEKRTRREIETARERDRVWPRARGRGTVREGDRNRARETECDREREGEWQCARETENARERDRVWPRVRGRGTVRERDRVWPRARGRVTVRERDRKCARERDRKCARERPKLRARETLVLSVTLGLSRTQFRSL